MLHLVLKALALFVFIWSQTTFGMFALQVRRAATRMTRTNIVPRVPAQRPYHSSMDARVQQSRNTSKVVAGLVLGAALVANAAGAADSLPNEAFVQRSLEEQCRSYHAVFDGLYDATQKKIAADPKLHDRIIMWDLEKHHVENLIDIFRYGVVYARTKLAHDPRMLEELAWIWNDALDLDKRKKLSPLEFSNLNIKLADLLAIHRGEYPKSKSEAFRIQDRASHMDSLTEQLGRFVFVVYGDVEITYSNEVKQYAQSKYPVWMVPLNASSAKGTWKAFDDALYNIPEIYDEQLSRRQEAVSFGYAFMEQLRLKNRNDDADVLERGFYMMMNSSPFSYDGEENQMARLIDGASREYQSICQKPDENGYFKYRSEYYALKKKWEEGEALPGVPFDAYWEKHEEDNGKRGNISEVGYYNHEKKAWERFLLQSKDGQGQHFLAAPTEDYRIINEAFKSFWMRFQDILSSEI